MHLYLHAQACCGLQQGLTVGCRVKEGGASEKVAEANAVCLATASCEGRPSNRMVLMKGYDQRGFMFYTNYSSRKGKELQQNSYASLCFWWQPLHRSVGLLLSLLLLQTCLVIGCCLCTDGLCWLPASVKHCHQQCLSHKLHRLCLQCFCCVVVTRYTKFVAWSILTSADT